MDRPTTDEQTTVALKTRAHDVELFSEDVRRYGLWQSDLKRAAGTFAQLGLDGMKR